MLFLSNLQGKGLPEPHYQSFGWQNFQNTSFSKPSERVTVPNCNCISSSGSPSQSYSLTWIGIIESPLCRIAHFTLLQGWREGVVVAAEGVAAAAIPAAGVVGVARGDHGSLRRPVARRGRGRVVAGSWGRIQYS